jgi:transcriptional regulator with XRE-family HTH domain
MPDASTVGDRLQSVRKRRGLSQAELAAEAGVSVSLIRQLEQGSARRTRLETAHRLAIALRVPTSALVSDPDAAPPASDDVDQWTAVRRALEGRAAGEPAGEPPTAEGVRAGLAEVWSMLAAHQYSQIRPILPSLLRDADVLVTSASTADGDQAEMRNLRSEIRSATSSLMCHTWQFDAADHAVQLALDDAGDGLTAAAVADRACWVLIRQGKLAEAREFATRWADDTEPRVSRASREELAVWGRLLLRVSTAAARDNRPGEATDALRLAQVAAAGVGRDFRPAGDPAGLHVFGPMMVSMIRAENAVVQDRPETTLRIASGLDGRDFLPSRNWYRHRLDVANALATTRQYPDAFDVLQQIRGQAPEWLVAQRYARDVLGKIINKRRTLTPQMRELADFVRVPY